jgi:hypothetical protein
MTPYKCFYGTKPQLDCARVFGSIEYVLVAPEKQKKLDDWAGEGRVVAQLPDSKGWTFWIPSMKKLMSSAWADFGNNALPVPPTKPTANTLELGNFSEEKLVQEQETNVDQANQHVETAPSGTPNTFKQAMKSSKSKEWRAAINKELANLRHKSVWTVKHLPKARRALGARWVFAKKPNANGTTRCKACYVAKGFNQREGTGYAHRFAPNATFTSMRILLTIAAKRNWPVSSVLRGTQEQGGRSCCKCSSALSWQWCTPQILCHVLTRFSSTGLTS